jgi:uncharacterized repeat protein (TIGR04076 family)
MARPKIKITVKERKGEKSCHRGHKIGDSYDFDTERGKICPMAMHVLFPVVDILRYGGSLPWGECNNKGLFACPDPDVLLVFEVEKSVTVNRSTDKRRRGQEGAKNAKEDKSC